MHTIQHDTPAGTLTTIVDDSKVIRAAGFTADARALATRLGLADAPPAITGGPVHSQVHQAIGAYLDGDLGALAGLPVDQPGTDFQHLVWAALRRVSPGTTATYGQLAAAIGRPGATRAVGSACGRNLIAPFVPCHRAVRSDGTTGGYYYGSHVKDWLLGHEAGQS